MRHFLSQGVTKRLGILDQPRVGSALINHWIVISFIGSPNRYGNSSLSQVRRNIHTDDTDSLSKFSVNKIRIPLDNSAMQNITEFIPYCPEREAERPGLYKPNSDVDVGFAD
jgi:hypothetical protein